MFEITWKTQLFKERVDFAPGQTIDDAVAWLKAKLPKVDAEDFVLLSHKRRLVKRLAPVKTSSPVLKILFAGLTIPEANKAAAKAGLTRDSSRRWRLGKNSPRLVEFEAFLEALGYRLALVKMEDDMTDKDPAPVSKVMGSDLLDTVKEFARWHHLNEVTLAGGGVPSDSEIDIEATAWNKIKRALATEAGQ